MKKLLAIAVVTVLLVFGMVMTANAAEYVYYENDFSNANTLGDFTQYRGEWSIVDGQLMLTGTGDLTMTDHCYIIYTKDEGIDNLTDYILEVDMMNIQSQAGPIVRSNVKSINAQLASTGTLTTNSFYGYLFFVSFTGEKAAIGRSNGAGDWAGNLIVSDNIMAPGTNIHLKVVVEGKNLTYIVTNKDTGAELYNHTMENDEWVAGSFGFRAVIMNSGLINYGQLGFDNLKVTATGAVGDWLAAGKALKDYEPGVQSTAVVPAHTDAIKVTVPEVVQVDASKLDVSKNTYVFYENDFSDAATIADFTQYRGEWTIKNGGLYYGATTSGFDATTNYSFILYSANHDANLLRNYTVEADIYNVQTAAGIISHSDISQAASRPNANSFYGYLSFVSNDATKFAVGYGNWEGNWGGNLVVGEPMANPGGNYHIKVAYAEDGTFTTTVTAVGSDEVMWTDTQTASDWSAGSFGFRNRVALDAQVNLDTAYWDNLKVTVYGEEAVLLNAGYHPNAEIVGEIKLPAATTGVELKMTLGQTNYTVNGETKTMDVAPIIRNERTMLPVRYVAEALGASIAWDGVTSTATLTTADTEIKITVGAATATVNGQSVTLDSPAFIESSRTYMPVRFVAETLGATVAWDGATSTATITK